MPTAPSVVSRHLALGVAAAFATGSCYATRALPAQDLRSLQRGGRSDDIVLRAGEQQQVRIRPGSRVRFLRSDGVATAWTDATHLRVTPEVAIINVTGDPIPLVLRWDEIAGIEVNDLDMGRTVIAVVGGTTVVILAMAAEAMIVAAISSLTNGHGGEIGLTRGAVQAVMEHAGERPVDDGPTLSSDVARGSADAALVSAVAPSSQPLFSWQARRRDVIRLGAEIEIGLGTGAAAVRPEATVTAGLRLWNVLDLGGGVAVLSDPDVPAQARSATTRFVPLVRVGLHLALDPTGGVALAVGEELGFGSGEWLGARTRWGMRFRLGDRWQLGVYPVNPRTIWTSESTRSRTVWVSAFELGWTI